MEMDAIKRFRKRLQDLETRASGLEHELWLLKVEMDELRSELGESDQASDASPESPRGADPR